MTGDQVAVFVGSLAVAAYFLGTPFLVRRLIARRAPWGIAARLDSPAGHFRVKVRSGTWDPGKPVAGRGRRLYGRGTAVYTVGEDGLVHLRFERSDGSVIESSGPVPSRASRKRRNVAPIATTACVVVLGGAAGAGVDPSEPLVGAAWGLLVGTGAGWVAASVLGAVLHIRKTASRNRR